MFQESGPSRPEADSAPSRHAAGLDDGAQQGRRQRHRSTRGGQRANAEAPAAIAPRPAGQGQANHQDRPQQPQGQPRNRQKDRNQRNKNRDNRQQGQGHNQGQRQGGNFNQRDRNGRVRRVRPVGRENLEIHHRHDRYDEEVAYERKSETWWADRWVHALERIGWKGRLANGRKYAAEGRVVAFTIEAGRIRAKVQGTRVEPYDVTIALKPLPDADWDLVVDIMSCQALFTAQLLAGEMPQDVEEVFVAARAPLFPRYKEDIQARCTCPDPANPCKHIAAVFYRMAEAFDKDPFLIFHLRGRSREALLASLREKRAEEAMAMPMMVETHDAGSLEPLRFWQAGEELEAVHIAVAPKVVASTAKRLGRPPFWRSPADPITHLGQIYEAIAKRAREVSLNEALLVTATES